MSDAPKRKTTKRGPTRAAALKALGLTAEDLATLKALRTGATADTQPPEGEHFTTSSTEHTAPNVVEGAATLQASSAPLGTGGPDPQAALESRQAPEQAAWNAPVEGEPVWYVRNLRGVDVGFRLTRQQKQGEKRTNLKPRGSRGDMVRLEKDDLRDPELSTQVGFGLVEVIPEGEAQEVIRKQYTNAQVQVPAHIAALTNEYGKPYEQANPVRMATDEEAYGIKVADLDPAVMQGQRTDKEIKRDGGITQGPVQMMPVQNPSPGPLVTSGFMAPVQQDMGSDNEKQAAVDAKLRAKQFEDRPEDNLGVKVTVEETQKVQ